MKPNMEEQLPLLKGKHRTREQKEEIINTIWQFAENFLDEVFSLHPVQQAQEVKSAKILQFQNKSLDSKDKFNNQAANDNDFAEKGKKHA